MTAIAGLLVFATGLLAVAPEPSAAQPGDSGAEVVRLLERVDDLMRGESSHGTMTMHVRTRRFERSMTLEVWSQGSERSLVRILSPAKEKGTATLKVEDQIWNYLPKVDRTIKVPASMMSGAWMGSHFSNNDLVREVRFSEDYECRLEDRGVDYGIACVPHEDTPVVWGTVEVVLDKQSELPSATRYYDERGRLARTMTYEDVREFSGRRLPTRVRVVPADDPDEYTEMVYEELEMDVEIPDRLFSLQSLKR